VLARLPLFAGLPRRALDQLARVTEDLEFPAGKVLCREDERPREFFMVVEGAADVTRGGDHVRRLGAGEFFGQLALIEDAPRSTTVTAATRLRVLVLSRHAFWRLLEESPEVERRVLRALVAENVAERAVVEEAYRRQVEVTAHQALHDPLTGLPNRTLFRDRVQQAALVAARYGGRFGVLMMDLDRFKDVNDTLGHHVGDLLLTDVAKRLNDTLRASDTIARLGGDEFGFLINRNSANEIEKTVRRVTAALMRPVEVVGLSLPVEGSIGIALFPEHGGNVEDLLRHADTAMYEAKKTGRSHTCYEHDDAASQDAGRLTLIADLREALDRRQIIVHYQPKADATGAITCVEALARWQHPERGQIPPNDFIPLAEHTSLIKPLTLYVIDEALRQSTSWQRNGLNLDVAVDLSRRNLLDTELPKDIERLLNKHGASADTLTLEITESAIEADPLRTSATVAALAAMGIRISIDDFGTGYSSLTHITRLPISEIKIDRSFVTNMLSDNSNSVVVGSIIELARNLNLTVVAEGVEDEATSQHLCQLNCDLIQGFHMQRPLPARELEQWLASRVSLCRSAAR
jgi:diguanylate cyclase (GGDEF)-like protein